MFIIIMNTFLQKSYYKFSTKLCLVDCINYSLKLVMHTGPWGTRYLAMSVITHIQSCTINLSLLCQVKSHMLHSPSWVRLVKLICSACVLTYIHGHNQRLTECLPQFTALPINCLLLVLMETERQIGAFTRW